MKKKTNKEIRLLIKELEITASKLNNWSHDDQLWLDRATVQIKLGFGLIGGNYLSHIKNKGRKSLIETFKKGWDRCIAAEYE